MQLAYLEYFLRTTNCHPKFKTTNLISHAKYPSQFDGKVRKMKLALFMVPFMAAIAHHHLLLYLGCKPAVAININDLRFLCLLALSSSSRKWLQLVFVDTVVKLFSVCIKVLNGRNEVS